MRTVVFLAPSLLGGLACAAWVLQSVVPEPLQFVALLAWLGLAGWLVWAVLHPAQGKLAWDGRSWQWSGHDLAVEGRVRSRLDWQGGMLLEFVPLQGRSVWLWLEKRSSPDAWSALRRAVSASPGFANSAGSEGPA